MRVLVGGCGWLGTAVARALVARGDRVTGVRRDPGRAQALAEFGVTPLALDLAAPGAIERLPSSVDVVVSCQSSASDTPEAYRGAYLAATATLLEAARRAGARAFVYTSSTGVFGQRDGGDVEEGTPPQPVGPTAEVLVEAERLVLSKVGLGYPGQVLRLSGLYGPGRAGTIDRVRRGALALGPGDDAFMNFCHLDDAVAFVIAALERGQAGATWHGSDAAPPRRREVVEWMAARLGIAPPRLPEGATAPPGPNRRVLSARTREALRVTLKYPSFREGFEELLAGGAPAPA